MTTETNELVRHQFIPRKVTCTNMQEMTVVANRRGGIGQAIRGDLSDGNGLLKLRLSLMAA